MYKSKTATIIFGENPKYNTFLGNLNLYVNIRFIMGFL